MKVLIPFTFVISLVLFPAQSQAIAPAAIAGGIASANAVVSGLQGSLALKDAALCNRIAGDIQSLENRQREFSALKVSMATNLSRISPEDRNAILKSNGNVLKVVQEYQAATSKWCLGWNARLNSVARDLRHQYFELDQLLGGASTLFDGKDSIYELTSDGTYSLKKK